MDDFYENIRIKMQRHVNRIELFYSKAKKIHNALSHAHIYIKMWFFILCTARISKLLAYSYSTQKDSYSLIRIIICSVVNDRWE